MGFVVGDIVQITVNAVIGKVTAENGHACKVAGCWHHVDDVELVSDIAIASPGKELTSSTECSLDDSAQHCDELIPQLVEMGYSQQVASSSAAQALKRCSSIEAALEWIFNAEARNNDKTETSIEKLWSSAVDFFDSVVSTWGRSANSPLPEAAVKQLCTKAKEILAAEKNIHNVNAPVTIVGDIHGQFHDLLRIFEVMGSAPEINYIFLGDYVDRGRFSVETIQFLVALKVRHPSRVTLLRGNHESGEISLKFGFFREVQRKYGSTNVWRLFVELFQYLPLGCLIDNKTFCVHGGLSPEIEKLDDIRSINRVQEIPLDGPMVDLLWSDPSEKNGWNESSRGAGYHFGPDVSQRFTHENGLRFISRAHQVVQSGYKWMHEDRLVTVYSAPNYGCQRNKGAVMTMDKDHKCDFRQFDGCINPPTMGIERQLVESLLYELDKAKVY